MRVSQSTGRCRIIALSLSVLVASVLSACGGGKSSFADVGTGEAQDPGNPPVQAPTPPSSSTSAGDPAARGTASPGPALGAMTLAWISPTTKADGTPLADLAGYRILLGTTSGVYSQTITVANPYAQTYAITGLPASTYYAVVKAFDSANNESSASAEVFKVVQ